MLEPPQDAVQPWLRRVARETPGVFGRAPGAVEPLGELKTASHDGCIYKVGPTRVHVKFFRLARGRTGTVYDPSREMRSEFTALKAFERRGFSTGKYQIVRALGTNELADCALATLYAEGTTLLDVITDTIAGRRSEAELYMALELTAGLLKRIHTEMPGSDHVDHCELFYSFFKTLMYLEDMSALDGSHRKITKSLTRWYGHKALFEQPGATIHGDANPSNFKIDRGIIYGYDVERSRPDRSVCADLGTLIADLGHQFLRAGAETGDAKPYVSHFLRAYGLDDKPGLAKTLSFYTAHGYLKIAMLSYWDSRYRRSLVDEGVRLAEEDPA